MDSLLTCGVAERKTALITCCVAAPIAVGIIVFGCVRQAGRSGAAAPAGLIACCAGGMHAACSAVEPGVLISPRLERQHFSAVAAVVAAAVPALCLSR